MRANTLTALIKHNRQVVVNFPLTQNMTKHKLGIIFDEY